MRAVTLGEIDGAGSALRATFDCDVLADVGRLHAERAFVLAVARQTRVERDAAGLRAGPIRRARALGGRVPRHHGLAAALADGASAGAAAASSGERGARAHRRPPAPRFTRRGRAPRRRALISARCPQASRTGPPEVLRRLAARCHHTRLEARRARGLPVHRARQALHHHRNGDRSGQDLESQCARDRRRKTSASRFRGWDSRHFACPTRR